ncbi:hypothetical protein [Vulgatibacter incomptus]|uniref:hypothetical protein n=1 Tax=Vulgatibacter incomptus TaxID=1391653 RepID=UPI0012F8CA27|nr:hypothetical protein [Vulgatibacter incomptus]
MADRSYPFRWTDFDDLAVGETTIDFFCTRSMPPTYRMGTQPLVSPDDTTVIVVGIPERDPANVWEWDTTDLPAGTWFLWSLAHDAPFEMAAFARGALTVAHPGDPVWPAVIVTSPDESSVVADRSFEIRYEAFDPDGSATVRIEATRSLDGSELILVADDLPAAGESLQWDTSALPSGDWMVKATIEDARGLVTHAFGRSFVRIDHGGGPGTGGTPGTGGSGGTGGIGGTGGAGGAGGEGSAGTGPGEEEPGGERSGGERDGCGCDVASSLGGLPWMGLALVRLATIRRRRAGGCDPGTPTPV